MREAADELKRALQGKAKVICEDSGDCYTCFVKVNDSWTIVAISQGKAWYAKLIPYESYPAVGGCEAMFASPIGLFAFADDPKKLVEQIIEKIERGVTRPPSRGQTP